MNLLKGQSAPRRARRYVLTFFFFALGVRSVSAEITTVEGNVRVSLQKKTDKTKFVGRVSEYDDKGFDLIRGKEAPLTIKWSELDATNLYSVRSILLAKGTADQWIQFGRDLRGIDEGEKFADKAFARALKIDPKVKDEVQKAKNEAPRAKESYAVDTKGAWPKLSEADQEAAIKTLNEYGEQTKKEIGVKLTLYETKFFLFYSDIPAPEAKNWSGLLDRMYGRLGDLFGIPRGENIWRGKAVVFVFSQADDYRKYERVMEEVDAGGSAGMCTSFSDGFVHIAFFRQPDELTFAHVLVHESVHGFLHRFRTPVNIVNWANEGLAEVIASELVPQPGRSTDTVEYAKDGLRQFGGLGGIFGKRNIEGWQYPVAETMCSFMIQQSKKNYVAFIAGIKEGIPWEECLEKKYKVSKKKLITGYAQSLGLKDLHE